MPNEIWETFLEYIEEHDIMPKYIAEYIAIMPIVKDCVAGYSNSSIARRTKYKISYIEETLEESFSFFGWESDLDFSPIALYNQCNKDIIEFENLVIARSGIPKLGIAIAYKICNAYNNMKEKIELYYKNEQ